MSGWNADRHERMAATWMRRWREANDAHNRASGFSAEARAYTKAKKCLDYAQQHERAAARKRAENRSDAKPTQDKK